jgi:hypothetical protein
MGGVQTKRGWLLLVQGNLGRGGMAETAMAETTSADFRRVGAAKSWQSVCAYQRLCGYPHLLVVALPLISHPPPSPSWLAHLLLLFRLPFQFALQTNSNLALLLLLNHVALYAVFLKVVPSLLFYEFIVIINNKKGPGM